MKGEKNAYLKRLLRKIRMKMNIEWINQRDSSNTGYINDICKINGEEMFEICAGSFAYYAKYRNPNYTNTSIIVLYENIERTVKKHFLNDSIENVRSIVQNFFVADYKDRVTDLIKKEVKWVDALCYTNPCASNCKKGDTTLFRIIRERDAYYTNYSNPSIFTVQRYSYRDMAKLAIERFGDDSEANRLAIVKEEALENYKKQIKDLREQLNVLDII